MSTTEHFFHFFPASSFSLELLLVVLPSSPVANFQPVGLIFWCHIPFAFSYWSWGSSARILKWFVIPSSSRAHFVRTFHYDPSFLGGPAWHGFIKLCKSLHHDKVVIHEGVTCGLRAIVVGKAYWKPLELPLSSTILIINRKE